MKKLGMKPKQQISKCKPCSC